MKSGLLSILLAITSNIFLVYSLTSIDILPIEGLGLNSEIVKGSKLNSDDLLILRDELINPSKLEALLLDHKLDFDTHQFSLPKAELEAALLKIVEGLRDSGNARIKAFLKSRFQSPSQEQSRRRLIQFLDNANADPSYIKYQYEMITEYINEFPQVPRYFNILIQYFHDSFEFTVLPLSHDFFAKANEYRPEVANKTKSYIDKLQQTYQLLPPGYYAELKRAYRATKNSSFLQNL